MGMLHARKARRWLSWLAPCMLVLAACEEGAPPVSDVARADPSADAPTAPVPPLPPLPASSPPVVGQYLGTLTSTFQVIDLANFTGATGPVTATSQLLVEVKEPFALAEDGTESNPFHLHMEAYPNPVELVPGHISFASATLQPRQEPPLPSPNPVPAWVVVQLWNYALNPTSQVFEGVLTDPLTTGPHNLITSAELGGPMSIPPNYVWEPCLAHVNKGARVAMSFTGDQFQLAMAGTAGGYLVGPTCMTEIQFNVTLTATRQAQPLPTPQPLPAPIQP